MLSQALNRAMPHSRNQLEEGVNRKRRNILCPPPHMTCLHDAPALKRVVSVLSSVGISSNKYRGKNMILRQ